jgi:hypothetical protein
MHSVKREAFEISRWDAMQPHILALHNGIAPKDEHPKVRSEMPLWFVCE